MRVFLAFTALTCLAVFGCTTARTTDTSRTGVEQLLLSQAVDQTLSRTALPDVLGQKVFLDAQYLESVDKGYVVASLRHQLLRKGAMLVDAKDQSDLTIEVRAGALGTDNTSSYVGTPSVSVPGLMPIELPEVRVWERKSQYGTAKIGLVAYDSATGAMVFDGGRNLARADDSRWSLLGVGPVQSGSVLKEVRAASSASATTRTANAGGDTRR